MVTDRYADLELSPDDGEVLDAELHVGDDVLLKAFALGPGARLSPHDHPDATNVFHVLEGTVTVLQGGDGAEVAAPGVVVHDRGVDHGARNDTGERAVLTAALCPMPG